MPLARSTEAIPLSPEKMGPPPVQTASSGRLNPDGIQCLYVALEEDTAVAEVRPWTGARLTVAEFRTKDELEVVDMTGWDTRSAATLNYRQQLLSLLVGRPVHREDRWGYLGTQYLAEALKAKGATGLLYDSSLRQSGSNLAIFATLTFVEAKTKLVDVYSVSYGYGPPPAMR